MTGKSLVYDGDCGFCRAVAASLRASRLVPAAACRSTRDLEPDELDWLRREGLNNEMIVLGPAGELRRGADGILWILRDGWGAPFAWLAGLPGVRRLTTHVYRLISYNRRAIAPPSPRGIHCDCDPDPHLGYQTVFAVLCAAFAWAVVALLSRAPWDIRMGSPLSYGGGFVLLALLALRDRRRDYLPHLAATAACGALVFLPGFLGSKLGVDAVRMLFVYGHHAAFILMTWLHGRHLAFLGMPARWQVAWMTVVPGIFLLGWLY